jgi:hypothetical protein
MKYTKEQIDRAWKALQQYRGKRIYARVNSVSRSGMSRRIEYYAATTDDTGAAKIERVGYYIARIIGESYDVDKGGLCITGCGMDMIFQGISSFNYAACGLDNPEMTWEALREKFGRIYDSYFFDANQIGTL